MAEDLRHEESVVVEADPDRVYALVTDIGRTGEWSPICTHCEWEEGDGPAVGARFVGHNTDETRSWETRSTVVAAEPGRKFAWEVGAGFVRWGYRLAPVAGGTELTESWEFLPAGLAMFREKYGDEAPARIRLRADQARAGIPETLAALKRLAESDA
ncbi:SRPBCC family protein [Nocardioides donggukensis]|uniref:SRPBCC family protein n=1 Tax=Nocardioides donggukensis TaxID=2774019 RepID=A0A927K3E1_9ACTN|nr:SRPBCC family protein [Nocardioides donggukensis]MBD8868235.1 SRPBCC family protein [Nocardioides donggukensis]